MPESINLHVHLAYDREAKVWYIAKSDIPGLSLEAATPGALVERIEACAPELIELNMADILAADAAKAKPTTKRKAINRTASARPRLSWLPVFDSPMELATA